MSDMQFIKWAVGTMPTALDMWLAVVAICVAFDRKIPRFVWFMIVVELITIAVTKAKGG